MKIAYMIKAHNEPELFKMLVSALDYSGNDIYVHIDRKSDVSKFNDVLTKYSNVVFLKDRIDEKWGHFSQVDSEIALFKAAHEGGPYDYYHLISGVDYPIKPQTYIHRQLEANPKKEFVGIVNKGEMTDDLSKKTRYYNFFTSAPKHYSKKYKHIFLLRELSFKIQDFLKIKRKYPFELEKGCNWVTITNDFCEYILIHESEIRKSLRYVLCVDEIFLQTLLWNSPFKDNIYNIDDEYDSCRRYIEWENDAPYVWKIDDFQKIVSSDRWFVRKMDRQSIPLMEKIKCEILFPDKNMK